MLNWKALDAFLDMQNSDNTKSVYGLGVRRLVAYLTDHNFDTIRYDWPNITQQHIIEWKAWEAKYGGLALASVSVYWDGCNSFFNFLVGSGLVKRTPFAGVKKPQRITNQRRAIPSIYDVQAIRAAAFDSGGGASEVTRKRNQAVIALLANGLRVSEVCDLNMGDLYSKRHPFDGEAYSVDDVYMLNVTGKGRKQRTVPLNYRYAWLPLAAYIVARDGMVMAEDTPQPDPSKPMFVTETGHRMSDRLVQHVFNKAVRLAGLTNHGFSPHSLRHNYATRMLQGGVDVFTVSKLLGHSNVQTTAIYLHLSDEDIAKASRKDPM